MDDRFEIRPYRSEDEAQVVFLVRELQAHESQLFDHMAPPAGIYALVGDLIVTQAARGQGIGTALLAECERLARQAKNGCALRCSLPIAGRASSIVATVLRNS